MSRIYVYVMTTDNGGAPHIADGLLSLAICKPEIRKMAEKGDLIIAFYGAKPFKEYRGKVAYIAVVDEVVGWDKYNVLYENRLDCIYNAAKEQKKNPFHDKSERERDTQAGVLVCEKFRFLGDKSKEGVNFKIGAGHRVLFENGEWRGNKKLKAAVMGILKDLNIDVADLSRGGWAKGKVGGHLQPVPSSAAGTARNSCGC